MSSPRGRLLSPVLLLPLLLVAAAVFVLCFRSTAFVPGARDPSERTGGRGEVAAAAGTVAPVQADGPEAERADVEGRAGVSGRVVGDQGPPDQGRPVAHARVYVFAVSTASPLESFAAVQRGVRSVPVADAMTGDDGLFAIELVDVEAETPLQLRVADDAHAELVRGFGPTRGEWLQLGDLQLTVGAVLSGVVRDDGSHTPIAGAVVTVERPELAGAPLPGREAGLLARTDADGAYRFANAMPGSCTVSVWAADHARVTLPHQDLLTVEANEIDFDLPPGGLIDGRVVDDRGRGVAGALVRAEQREPLPVAVEARSDGQGWFTVLGVGAGEFELSANAVGFRRAHTSGVPAGARGLRLELAPQAAVRLRVIGSHGELDRYRAIARRFRDGSRSDSSVPVLTLAVGPEQVHDGVAELRGFEAGSYCLEVAAAGFAKAFSEPFAIVDGASAPEITVQLAEGGTLRGVVRDAAGAPRRGVAVESLPAEFSDNAASAVFRSLLAFQVTDALARTATDGSFTLRHLAPGEYQLKVDDAAFAPCFVRGLMVAEGAVTDAGEIRLAVGAEVGGTVALQSSGAASPAAGVVVQLSALSGSLPRGFQLEVTADAQGRFTFARRLPAGSYQVAAGRRDAKNRFQESADLAASRREIAIRAGQDRVQVDLQIPGP